MVIKEMDAIVNFKTHNEMVQLFMPSAELTNVTPLRTKKDVTHKQSSYMQHVTSTHN